MLAQAQTQVQGLPDPGFAPAKINLALHVTGQRPGDGYHLLDSLVVFAGLGDQVSATAARDLTLTVDGQFSHGVPTDDGNLVLRAAKTLQAARNVPLGAKIRLTKSLPHAAGIGGGSSDAAATLRLLARLWNVPPLSPYDPEVLALGADVPACLCAPVPVRMRGVGEDLTAAPVLPSFAMVLVNPRVEVPTAEVFRQMAQQDHPALDPIPSGADLDRFCAWLTRQRNDLQPGAEALAPQIGDALSRLRARPGVLAAVMSGSGATCVGITRDMGTARQVARAVQVAEMSWWVVPAPLLS